MPLDGVAHQCSVHTVGGVITAGELMMLVVSEADASAVEVKIAPRDMDQVHVDRTAARKFSAFHQRTTPEVDGTVSLVFQRDRETARVTGRGCAAVKIRTPVVIRTVARYRLLDLTRSTKRRAGP